MVAPVTLKYWLSTVAMGVFQAEASTVVGSGAVPSAGVMPLREVICGLALRSWKVTVAVPVRVCPAVRPCSLLYITMAPLASWM